MLAAVAALIQDLDRRRGLTRLRRRFRRHLGLFGLFGGLEGCKGRGEIWCGAGAGGAGNGLLNPLGKGAFAERRERQERSPWHERQAENNPDTLLPTDGRLLCSHRQLECPRRLTSLSRVCPSENPHAITLASSHLDSVLQHRKNLHYTRASPTETRKQRYIATHARTRCALLSGNAGLHLAESRIADPRAFSRVHEVERTQRTSARVTFSIEAERCCDNADLLQDEHSDPCGCGQELLRHDDLGSKPVVNIPSRRCMTHGFWVPHLKKW